MLVSYADCFIVALKLIQFIEFFFQCVFHLLHGTCSPKFLLHGSHPESQTTGIDITEVPQVGVHVQGKAVHGHIPADTDADGANFTGTGWMFGVKPHTGSPLLPASLQSE